MSHTYLKWIKPQSVISVPFFLLPLLCSCGSSSVPDEPSSTREREAAKVTDRQSNQTIHVVPNRVNVSSIQTPNLGKKSQKLHVQTNHSDSSVVQNQMPNEDISRQVVDSRRNPVTYTVPSRGSTFAIQTPDLEQEPQKLHVQTNHSGNSVVQSQVSNEDTSHQVVDSRRNPAIYTAHSRGSTFAIQSPDLEQKSQTLHAQTGYSDTSVVQNHVSNEGTSPQVDELSSFTEPSESGAELLQAKLEDPGLVLDTTQSISLVEHCAQEGERNAASATDKDAIAILGETGVGKSTSVNSWIGCQMVLVAPEELGIQEGLAEVIAVSSDSAQSEVTSIGHESVSQTFLPKIIQDPSVATRVYLDLPGFSDNRGAEINIANTINIKKVLQQASGVKAVFLAKYSDLEARRSSAVQTLENTCEKLFGGIENLRRYQDSVLLGVNRAPLNTRLNRMRTRCAHMGSPIMQILADHLFLYDPLERGGADFWSREQLLGELEGMPSIPLNITGSLFQTALTDSDKAMLQNIVEHQVSDLEHTLEQENYLAASRC
jgi:hypothetical protein